MPEQLEYRGAPFGVSATRDNDKVTIRFYRTSDKALLVELETTPKSARVIAAQIIGAL